MSLLTIPTFCQQATPVTTPPPEPQPKRFLCIIPNFRTSPRLAEYKPLDLREKFRIATLDSFHRGTVGLFATEAQLRNSNPSFGQGVRGYAHYFGTGSGWSRVGWTHNDSGRGQFNFSEIAGNSGLPFRWRTIPGIAT